MIVDKSFNLLALSPIRLEVEMTQIWPDPVSFEAYFRHRLEEESELARIAPNLAERGAHLPACTLYSAMLELDEGSALG